MIAIDEKNNVFGGTLNLTLPHTGHPYSNTGLMTVTLKLKRSFFDRAACFNNSTSENITLRRVNMTIPLQVARDVIPVLIY